jgi:hypothetical protein
MRVATNAATMPAIRSSTSGTHGRLVVSAERSKEASNSTSTCQPHPRPSSTCSSSLGPGMGSRPASGRGDERRYGEFPTGTSLLDPTDPWHARRRTEDDELLGTPRFKPELPTHCLRRDHPARHPMNPR